MKLKQVWIPYWEWEDYKAGMWKKIEDEKLERKMLRKAIRFTGDWVKYGRAMKKVVKAWPQTMINSLTNASVNQRAFVGHCAVHWKLGIPEYITRMAWKELTDKQREDADAIAQQTIDKWKIKYAKEVRRVHRNMAKKVLS